MLSIKKQHQYLSRRWYAIRVYIREFAWSAHPEILHQLRVEVKKVRAFVRFAGYGGCKVREAMAGVKELFRAAGEMREASLGLDLMERYRVRDAAVTAEKERFIAQKAARFAEEETHYHAVIRRAAAALHKKMRPLHDRRTRHWFAAQLEGTAAMLGAPLTDALHDARKKIKTLLYVHDMLPARTRRRVALNKDYLKALQERIGNWHDVVTAATMLPADAATVHRLHSAAQKEERQIAKAVGDFGRKAAGKEEAGAG